eukprot:gene2964-4974_t
MEFKVRKAVKEDIPHIMKLTKELAEYEKAPEEVTITEEDLLNDGFNPDKPTYFHCLLVEFKEKVIGFSFYFFSYSTWKGKCLYLEDLYVQPEYRGKSIGTTLLAHLSKIASENKCKRMQWQAIDWNKPARDFYNTFSSELNEWITYRMEENQIQEFIKKHENKLN